MADSGRRVGRHQQWAPTDGTPLARRWARVIYDSYPEAQGLWSGSWMAASAPCVALFEHAADSLPAAPAFHRALADATLEAFLVRSAAELGYRLAL